MALDLSAANSGKGFLFSRTAEFLRQDMSADGILPVSELLRVTTRAANFGSRTKYIKHKCGVVLASSAFGIDGSSSPTVRSWGYQASSSMRKRSSMETASYRSNSSRETMSSARETSARRFSDFCTNTPQIRTGFSSPYFPSNTSRSRNKHDIDSMWYSLLPDMTIQRANLNKRPKAKPGSNREFEIEREYSTRVGFSRSISESSRTTQYLQNKQMVGEHSKWKTDLEFEDYEDMVSDLCQQGEIKENKPNSSLTAQSSPREGGSRTAPLRVRKIYIKLPCLDQTSELK